VQGRADTLADVDLVKVRPRVILGAGRRMELGAEGALVGCDRGWGLVTEVEMVPTELVLGLFNATPGGGIWVGDPLTMLLMMARGLVRDLGVPHRVVMSPHHLDVFHAFQPVLPLQLVLALLIRKLGDGVDDGACAGGTDFPVGVLEAVLHLGVDLGPLEAPRGPREVDLVGGGRLEVSKDRATDLEVRVGQFAIQWRRRASVLCVNFRARTRKVRMLL
jgi:hypothetical protein